MKMATRTKTQATKNGIDVTIKHDQETGTATFTFDDGVNVDELTVSLQGGQSAMKRMLKHWEKDE